MGTLRKSRGLISIALLILLVSAGSAHAAGVTGVVDSLLAKYKNAGQGWVGTLKNAATSIFWILATISLSWTCISMAIKRAELGEFFAELCRFIMFTGLFFWLLINGPGFANDVITSLWKVGGEASGTGNSIYPGTLIDLAMQVFQNTLQHVNFLQPESIVAPIIITLIILIVCALIAVNMILLLCAAWVVLYAGIIFLGFGGCRWTSDMAINYYRTVLGVGVSLMTMQLIIGLGINFLQDLFAASGQTPDAPTLAILMVACIILAVIAHRLPQMVAGMVVGGGHNGAIGGIGMMTLLGTGIAATSMAGSAAAAARTAGSSQAAAEANNLLMERIKLLEADNASESGGSRETVVSNPPAMQEAGITGDYQPTTNDPTQRPNVERAKPKEEKQTADSSQSEESAPPLTRPMTPDEQRGFPPPTDPPEWQK